MRLFDVDPDVVAVGVGVASDDAVEVGVAKCELLTTSY